MAATLFAGKFLGFLALLLAGQGGGAPRVVLPPAKRPRDLPLDPVAPEWPVKPPADLPAFPGNGWEYDQPPSAGVMQRAYQLLPSLWAQGVGAYQTEYLEGHWVSFLAEIVSGGMRGVTAWRVRIPGAPPAPSPSPSPSSVVVPPGPAPAPPPFPIIPSTVVIPVHPAALGMDPKDVQEDLNLLGYGPLDVDGVLGPQSKTAIKAFQTANPPLAVDGIVGQQTASVLQAKVSALHGSDPVLPSTPSHIGVQSVHDIQDALNKLQYGPLTVDGIMGQKTASAIRNFQGDHPPLLVDGVPGPQTKTALDDALNNSVFIEHDSGTA